jgi:hypothetical protein
LFAAQVADFNELLVALWAVIDAESFPEVSCTAALDTDVLVGEGAV